MSKLSKFFHKLQGTGAVTGVVEYLDKATNLTNEQKRAIATKVVSTLHVETGGVLGEVETLAIGFVVDWVVAEAHSYVDRFAHPPVMPPIPAPPPIVPPVPVPAPKPSGYDMLFTGELPDDAHLLEMGFINGDLKWVAVDKSGWKVSHPGGFYNSEVYTLVGPIKIG